MLLHLLNAEEINNGSEFAENSENKDLKEKDFDNLIKIGYSSSYNASGGNFNVSLHQSIVNNTRVEIANTSDLTNITFYESCPTDTNFNSTFINITIEDIYAPNKTLVVEEDDSDAYNILVVQWYTSFELNTEAYVDNVSIKVRNTGGSERYYVNLFDSQKSGNYIKFKDDLNGLDELAQIDVADTTGSWVNVSGINYKLDPSTTYNNTFFVGIKRSGTRGNWYYENQGDGDDTISWSDLSGSPEAMDMTLIVKLVPLNHTPKPTDIGLKINNISISDYPSVNGSGYWNVIDPLSSATGSLKFNLTSDWWDASCNVTHVQINYTKNGIIANSEFNISGSGNDVIWNVTIEENINEFGGSDFTNKYINYTIPSSWNLIQAFNQSSKPHPNSTWDRDDGWQLVKVLNVSNGGYWGLNASSENLMKHIRSYVGGKIVTDVNITDIVDFWVNFSSEISGNVNITVYTPSPEFNINFSYLNNTTPASLINLSLWDLQEDNATYGENVIQAFWSNNTAAGFLEVPLIILGETELILFEPPQNKEFLSTDNAFNITFCFNDTSHLINFGPINDSTITYSIAGQSQKQTNQNNGTFGYYNITVDPTDPSIDPGDNNVTIYINKTYYNNLTLVYKFKKVAATQLTGPFPNTDVVILNQNATFQLNYSTSTGTPLEKADIKLVNIAPFSIWSYSDDGSGNYTIRINSTGADVGTYPCEFNISSSGNETQVINMNIQVINIQTDIDVSEYNSTLVRWQGYDQSIVFYFNDTDNNLPIDSLTNSSVVVHNGTNPTEKWRESIQADNWTLYNLTGGYYRLNVSIADLDSGNYSMIINASKSPNYNWSVYTIDFYIRGNYSAIGILDVSDPGGSITPTNNNYTTFIGSNINIEFNFTDSENNGIIIEDIQGDQTDNAAYLIEYESGVDTGIISHSLSYDRNYDTHRGSLSISGLTVGEYNITIIVSRKNYENATKVIGLIIIDKNYVNITLIEASTLVSADGKVGFKIKFEYKEDSIWEILHGSNTRRVPIINGVEGEEKYNLTDSQGYLNFSVSVPAGVLNVTVRITALSTYKTISKTEEFTTILIKFDVNATIVDIPDVVVAGTKFNVSMKIEYTINGVTWYLLPLVQVECVPIVDGVEQTGILNSTNSQGIVSFTITLPLDATNVSMKLIISSTYNTIAKSLNLQTFSVTPPAVIPIEIIIAILIIVAVAVAGFVAYRKIIVPSKEKKREAVMEVATAFDDAVNLEHILVLYRNTGTCIFFKSFGAEEIDPELISGFLTAVQSFGKEIKYQQSLNEITYGEKMILLSDGEYIRVALVLGKKGSVVMRKNITRFIKIFEGRFSHILPSWKGQLHVFHQGEDVIDQAFNTSIILPHEVNADTSKVKQVKSPLAKRLLKLANNLTAESERKFFFIASLLNEATDKTGEEAAELFVAIRELRETEAIVPIKIEKIAPEEVSEHELNIIRQRIASIQGYSDEEKQKLIQEIARLSPSEREAAITSLMQGQRVVSAPVQTQEGAGVVSDAKAAKKELSDLEKTAKGFIRDGDLVKAVEIYQNAASFADTWGLAKESEGLRDKARSTSIEFLEKEIKSLVKDAEKAVKANQFKESVEKYMQASSYASEIFKLGVTSKQREVREYQNKAREYEKYI